jgi:hypothetical protein
MLGLKRSIEAAEPEMRVRGFGVVAERNPKTFLISLKALFPN